MFFTHLTVRSLLFLSGEDTHSFLQGLISNDIRKLESGGPIYTALLTPQGKYLHDFFLYPADGGVWLDVATEKAGDLKQRLMLYKLRSKVTIEILPETMGIVAVWGGQRLDRATADPRLPELGYRMVGDVDKHVTWCKEQGFTQKSMQDYNAMRIALGVPDGVYDMTSDKSLLLEFGIDQLHGVDFNKGCYVGQEVTARTKHRGGLKRFIYVVQADTALAQGAMVKHDENNVGEVLSTCGNQALALLRVEAVEKAAGGDGQLFVSLISGDIPVRPEKPVWAQQAG